jgi:hypothetical protein
MTEYRSELVELEDLLGRLQMRPAGGDKAYGEVLGSPVTLTVLGLEPLAVLLGFKVQSPHPAEVDLPNQLGALVSAKKAEVILEKGIAWLSLDNLTGESGESIEALIKLFARQLADAGLRVPGGCLRCQSPDRLELVYGEGRCSRLCADCRDGVVIEQVKREFEMNRPQSWYGFAFPLIFLYVSCCWALLWWLVDTILFWSNTNVITFQFRVDYLLSFAALVVIACAIGCPIGVFLRKSGFPGQTQWQVSAAVVLLSGGVGEWLYVATLVYRHTGTIDLALAAEQILPVWQSHHSSWTFLKLLVVGAIGLGCNLAAKIRHSAPVRL